ncbi:MAG: hypothetical protein KA066_03105 [Candidatus Pacebacteria bacterium]|nr:hypothetical protein [Candidatus Paceibacterota bacterium]
MEVLYSAVLHGKPVEGTLKLEFLKSENSGMIVQTTHDDGAPINWDYGAIASGDFNGDKLKGLKEYAKEVCPEVERPVITLRTIIIHESEHIFRPEPSGSARKEAQVVHSQVRHLDP